MMEINRNNYEAYFIDYLEGNLDEKLVDSFIEFIKLNPDLKEELALFESVSAIPEIISFDKKDSLFKEKYDSEKEFENAAIALLEGDISAAEKSKFENYLSRYPEKKKEAAVFAQTKLKADQSIQFTKKNKLYRKSLGKTVLLWSTRVAAILIFAALFGLYRQTSTDTFPVNQVAEVENKTPKKETETTPEQKITPVEEKRKVPQKEKRIAKKPEIKKAVPEKKSHNSIRETTKGRLEEGEIAAIRIPVEVPAEMQALTASFHVEPVKATMATMYLAYPTNYYNNEMLLADKVREKINFNKITKAGLNLFASISNEKFTYQTNKVGEVTEYKYDSRLLAFSIHGKKAQPE